jgi:hypothetical protein
VPYRTVSPGLFSYRFPANSTIRHSQP